MALQTGSRLGPFEIQRPLGAGGMGEVYKALDTRLNRVVAIKVLASRLATDPTFRERFEHEARAISALDHPNICALYDVGEQNGTSFLVMQYLEGETLAERLKKGTLPLDQTLRCAIEIAEALDRAHRAGIVHRDLKPGNIMLTKTGAKLLDFGLAKVAPAIASTGLSMLPTTPAGLTEQGTILGTFQYMSPEQLEGHEADARSDVFAFGAVVYEMVTGERAFDGKTHASLISAIMKDDPRPMSALQPLAPATLDRVVRKCLAKQPERRWQSVSDLSDALRWVVDAPPPQAPIPVAAGRRSNRVMWASLMVASIATLTAIALAFAYSRSGSRGDGRTIRLSIPPPRDVRLLNAPGQMVPAVSPDGRRVAFVGSSGSGNQLLVRSLDALDAQPVAGAEGGNSPFWSPDSRTLAFFTQGSLKVVDVAGGPVRALAAVNGFRGTWNAEGVILIGSGPQGGLFKIPANGGMPTPLTQPGKDEAAHRFPEFLPDGKHFLYLVVPSNSIWLGSLDGGTPTRLLASESQAIYVAPGYLLFVRQGTLMAQPFDARSLTLTAEAVPIAEQVLTAAAVNLAGFSAASSGVLAYRMGSSAATTQLRWADRYGRVLGTVGQPGRYRNVELSPDSTRVALEAMDAQGRTLDTWLGDPTREVTSSFTFDPANDLFPIWSPDGSRVVFGSDRDGTQRLYQKRSDGVGSEERLLKSNNDTMVPLGWAPDGRSLVYAGGPVNIGIVPLDGEGAPHSFESPPSRFAQAYAQVSPDGRWLSYTSVESGRAEIYVQSFPTPGGGKWQVSKDGGAYSRWRRDGKEIFYYANDGKLVAVPIQADAGFKVGTAVPVSEPRLLNGPAVVFGFKQQYDVTRDGRFLLNVPVDDGPAASSITVVTDWTTALKK